MKPELLHDERIACRSDTARLLYYGLLGIVDDDGHAKAAPAYLHGAIFWGRPRPLARVKAALDELIEAGLVRTYEGHEGVSQGVYLEICEWSTVGSLTYQRVDRRTPSTVPQPKPEVKSSSSTRARRKRSEDSTSPRLPFVDGSGSAIRDLDQGSGSANGSREDAPTPASEKSSDHLPALDRFHTLYFDAYGTKPTWNGKTVAMLKRLVASHSPREVIRRMEILFTKPPAWLSPPFDIGTLVQHFDKLAAAASDPRRGLSDEQIIRLGEDMTREMGLDRDAS